MEDLATGDLPPILDEQEWEIREWISGLGPFGMARFGRSWKR
jgi:hypothetical protein